MAVIRSLFVFPLFALLVGATHPSASGAPVRPSTAHNGGILHGKIVRIDYIEGRMVLLSRRNHKVNVQILPSTNIQGRASGYHTIADLKKGATIDVLTSIEGRRTNAEIITIY